jgi:hypothetical protein
VAKIIAGDWKKGQSTAEATAGMPASDFPARMAWQSEAAAREIRSVPVSTLLTEDMTMPWGETLKRGEALFIPLRWLIGYRMQLFLYLKSAGAAQLNTTDCWRTPASEAAVPVKAA